MLSVKYLTRENMIKWWTTLFILYLKKKTVSLFSFIDHLIVANASRFVLSVSSYSFIGSHPHFCVSALFMYLGTVHADRKRGEIICYRSQMTYSFRNGWASYIQRHVHTMIVRWQYLLWSFIHRCKSMKLENAGLNSHTQRRLQKIEWDRRSGRISNSRIGIWSNRGISHIQNSMRYENYLQQFTIAICCLIWA